jgi:hypothetical protein
MWLLAIDFGTSFTSAAVRRDGLAPQLVSLDGGFSTRSCVLWDARADPARLVAGRLAAAGMARAPGAFVGTPKRLIDLERPFQLGERGFAVSELIAAVLEHVLVAVRGVGDGPPAELRLTHPADWEVATSRLGVLRAAAELALKRAGWEGVPIKLMPEPVAAAIAVADQHAVPAGACIAVYDLGGGTFDAAVVRRTMSGFEVLGAAEGMVCGGEAFDDLLLEKLHDALTGVENAELLFDSPELPAALTAEQLAELDPERQQQLKQAQTKALRWLAGKLTLRERVRECKELLSGSDVVDVEIPVLDRDIQISRHQEFEQWIEPQILETIGVLENTITEAKAWMGEAELENVVLTGGASRIPLVEQLVHAQTKLPTVRMPDPKGIVAFGAARDPLPPPDGPPRELQPPRVLEPPTLRGDVVVGATLRSAAKFTGREPITKSYQWARRRGSDGPAMDIAAARGQGYTITDDDVEHSLRVQVTARNEDGSAFTETEWTLTVPASDQPPRVLEPPTLRGDVVVGATLSPVVEFTGREPITKSYQWARRRGSDGPAMDIAAARGQGYTITDDDVEHSVRVQITARNEDGSALIETEWTPAIPRKVPSDVYRSFFTVLDSASRMKSPPIIELQIKTAQVSLSVSATAVTVDKFVEAGVGRWTAKGWVSEPPFLMEVAGIPDGRAVWITEKKAKKGTTSRRQLSQYAVVDNCGVIVTVGESIGRSIADAPWTVRLDAGASSGVLPVVTVGGLDPSTLEETLFMTRTDKKGKGDWLKASVTTGVVSVSNGDFIADRLAAVAQAFPKTALGEEFADLFLGGHRCARHTLLHRAGAFHQSTRTELWWAGVVERHGVVLTVNGAKGSSTELGRAAELQSLVIPAARL